MNMFNNVKNHTKTAKNYKYFLAKYFKSVSNIFPLYCYSIPY